MDDETSTYVFYSVAIMGGMTWYYWSAAMSAIGFWCWYKTRIVGALIMALGFLIHFSLQLANRYIPSSIKQGSAAPEPVYVNLHVTLGLGAMAALIAVLVGFAFLCVAVTKRTPVEKQS